MKSVSRSANLAEVPQVTNVRVAYSMSSGRGCWDGHAGIDDNLQGLGVVSPSPLSPVLAGSASTLNRLPSTPRDTDSPTHG